MERRGSLARSKNGSFLQARWRDAGRTAMIRRKSPHSRTNCSPSRQVGSRVPVRAGVGGASWHQYWRVKRIFATSRERWPARDLSRFAVASARDGAVPQRAEKERPGVRNASCRYAVPGTPVLYVQGADRHCPGGNNRRAGRYDPRSKLSANQRLDEGARRRFRQPHQNGHRADHFSARSYRASPTSRTRPASGRIGVKALVILKLSRPSLWRSLDRRQHRPPRRRRQWNAGRNAVAGFANRRSEMKPRRLRAAYHSRQRRRRLCAGDVSRCCCSPSCSASP